jgi:hypothetical protein
MTQLNPADSVQSRTQTWLETLRALENRSEFHRSHESYELPPRSEYLKRREVLERLNVRDEFGRRLIDQTRLFAHSFYAQQAINLGWTDSELFNLDDGLVPMMVCRRTRGLTIKEFTSGNVRLQDNHSNIEVWRRPSTNGPPWWLDTRLIPPAEDNQE